jgi:integrase
MLPPQWDRPSSALQPADKPRSESDERSRQAGQTSASTDAGMYASGAVAGRLWDVKQAAEFLHVSVSWVRRHLSELPHSRHGRLIHFNPDDLKRTVTDRKSLEPTRRLMPNNRYQRGGVYLRGKKKMWYGTYRLDTPEGRRPIHVPLGTLRELPTKVSARDKLRQKIAEMTKTDVMLQTASSLTFSELVERWERTELEPSQTLAIIERLKEPYSTLVLFLGLLGRRIEEARGMQPSDLDDNNILHVRRVIYNGRVEELEGEQLLPLDQPEHAELVRRLRSIGAGHEWLFHSRKGTPIDPGNARRRYLKPAAQAVGIEIGGWHDFRHTLVRKMRRAGVHPVVISAIVGHKSVELAPEVYDRANMDEKRQALGLVGKQLLPDVLPSGSPH